MIPKFPPRMVLYSLLATISIGTQATDDTAANGAAVFARAGDAVVTHDLLDAALSRIPERDRAAFVRDGGKLQDMVKQMLRNQLIANDARRAGFDRQPLVGGRVALAAERELANAWLDEVARTAPLADYEQMAREHYLLNKEKYRTPPTYDVTHLLVSTSDRTAEEAAEIAAGLLAGASEDPDTFDELVRTHSDDPAVASNQGRYTNVGPGRMVAPFEQAALALAQVGDISGLVETRFGYHIIRLDGRAPARQQSFDEVRDRLIAFKKAEYAEDVKSRYVSETVGIEMEVPEGAIEQLLQRYLGEDPATAPR